jgi:hypothetical protein
MIEHGAIVEIAYPDINTKEEYIRKVKWSTVNASFKRVTVRTKITTKQEEVAAFKDFSDTIEKKRQAGLLLHRTSDTTMLPCFLIEYPKVDYDGSYFVVTSFTELMS